VLDEGLEAAALAGRASAGAIYLGARADLLRCVAAFGLSAKLALERGVPKRDLATRAMNRRTPFILGQALLTPLFDGDKAIGLLELQHPKSPNRFTPRDLRVVEGMARYITTSLVQTSSLRRQEGLAAHDPLTGLRNVRELNSELTRAVGVTWHSCSSTSIISSGSTASSGMPRGAKP
jgi:GAF domain-containing protein